MSSAILPTPTMVPAFGRRWRQLCFRRKCLFRERSHDFFVAGGVHQIAEPVVSAGEGVPHDQRGIFRHDVAHFAGDKAVAFPVDDENGHRCLFHCPGGVHFVNVKAAVDPPADLHKRPCQAVVLYLGKVLPPAMMGLLTVYCFKNVSWLSGTHGAPELLASAAVVGLHLWKRNVLFSIAGGTALYMVLVQAVFA